MVIRARARELTDALEAASMAGLAVTCDLGPKHVTYAEDGKRPSPTKLAGARNHRQDSSFLKENAREQHSTTEK